MKFQWNIVIYNGMKEIDENSYVSGLFHDPQSNSHYCNITTYSMDWKCDTRSKTVVNPWPRRLSICSHWLHSAVLKRPVTFKLSVLPHHFKDEVHVFLNVRWKKISLHTYTQKECFLFRRSVWLRQSTHPTPLLPVLNHMNPFTAFMFLLILLLKNIRLISTENYVSRIFIPYTFLRLFHLFVSLFTSSILLNASSL
jgi:hypothetical protein